jgi:hypothetical protein
MQGHVLATERIIRRAMIELSAQPVESVLV